MSSNSPRPEPEDLHGEIERLRARIAEQDAQLALVEAVGITVDLDHNCCWWHKVKWLPH